MKQPESVASDVWLDFLRRVPAFADADFEQLCSQRPDLVEELRALRSEGRTHTRPGCGTTGRFEAERNFEERLRLLAEPVLRGARFLRKEVLAEGGMGLIRRVRDIELNRELVLKETKLGVTGQRPLEAARFFEEAQVTAQLDHPGIVPIHEVGLDADGRLYFAMKLVQGRDLRAILDLVSQGREGWTQTRMLGVLLKVCEAMAYAHSKGVIHRDLKPGNVMVGHFGEVYVMDWGLARVMGRPDMHDIRVQTEHASESVRTERREEREETPDSPLVTMDGVVVGTPAYMPPEQARGEIQLLSRRSDVYSIGALLYHLLTGQAPHVPPGVKVSARNVLWRVIEGPPRPVHELNEDVPAELAAICEKAMARDPDQRYQDTLVLGEDLRAYLEGRVVLAHETGALAELRKWVGRNKGLATASAAAILALLGGLATSSSFYVRAAESATLARSEKERADVVAAAARRKADEVLRLSALQILAELESEADELWPALPEQIERFEDWLRRAHALVAELPRHEETLGEMRSKSRPWNDEERALQRARSPAFSELQAAERELEYRRGLQAALAAGEPARVPSVEEAAVMLAPLPNAADKLDALAWPLVDPARIDFGSEATGLVLARRAVELAATRSGPERAALRKTLAWALLANGLYDEAVAEAEQALEEAHETERAEFERGLAALERAIQHQISPEGMEEEQGRLAEVSALVARLEAEVSELPPRTFDSSEDHWWHDQLEKLIAGLKEFSDAKKGLLSSGASPEHGWGVEKRLEFARTIQERSVSGTEAEALWSKAIASIRDRSQCAPYDGLALTPQLGFLPIGRDPASGLWEFAHLQTGEPPRRAADGRLILSEQTGLVFVLLPGGAFWMGAQRSDPSGRNYDALAMTQESPVSRVHLAPFFLSKYEMTQGQWLRLTGRNPSLDSPETYSPTWNAQGLAGNLLLPIEGVTCTASEECLARIGLRLPTEAQWEYAARAGTETPWWTGSEPESLAGSANLLDSYAKQHGGERWADDYEPWLDDGHTSHARVGSFLPNGFGLHDMIGNVWEWCQDWYPKYTIPPRPGDGMRAVTQRSEHRIVRGGSMNNTAADARSSFRYIDSPETSGFNLGLRPARAITNRLATAQR